MAKVQFLWLARLGQVRVLASVACLLGVAVTARAEINLSGYSPTHPLKIMAIGDSITDDCSINGAWRLYLQPMLETNGYPFIFVGRQSSNPIGTFTKTRHEGYCGSVIAPPGMLTTPVHGYAGTNVYLLKIVADALTNTTPDLVLLVMGANDIGRGRDPYHVATVDMPNLLDLILSNAPAANIIITKTTTLSNAVASYGSYAPNVPIYNGALQAMVNQRRAAGQNVFLADMFSVVNYATMFLSDHLHPNSAGLNAMAKEFCARIQAITVGASPVVTNLITGGADWKYSDTGEDLGTNWTSVAYDDSSWKHGLARLGYGDPVAATTISFGLDPMHVNPTTYFRHAFVLPDSLRVTNLNVRLARADGAVVWLNGSELFRVNMPAGPIGFTNLAYPLRVLGEAPYIFNPTNLAVAALPGGTNVLAVEVHPRTLTNSFIGFDLELSGTGYLPPLPSLALSVGNNQLGLSWPASNSVGYSLYATARLDDPWSWAPELVTVTTNNGQCQAVVAPTQAQTFFRLQKP